MASVNGTRPSPRSTSVNPMGTDGFEFVEYAAPDPAALGALFEQHGLRAGRPAPLQGRLALPPGRRQLHRQRRAGQLRPGLRARARAQRSAPSRFRVKDAACGLQARAVARRLGRRGQGRADGAQHPGDQGHRRFADLPGRPLRRARHASTTSTSSTCRASSAIPTGVGPDLHRPPDAQRASRPHGRVGGVLRAALQLPRDPLLRHRGQADRAEVARR